MVTGWLPEQSGAAREAVRRSQQTVGPDDQPLVLPTHLAAVDDRGRATGDGG